MKILGQISLLFWEVWSCQKHRSNIVLCLFALGLSTVCNVITPWVFRDVVNRLEFHSTETRLIFLLFAFGFIWTLGRILLSLREIFVIRLSEETSANLAIKLIHKIFDANVQELSHLPEEEVIFILKRAQEALPLVLWGSLSYSIPAILEFILTLCVLIAYFPFIHSLIFALTLIGYVSTTYFLTKRSAQQRLHANNIDLKSGGQITNYLMNAETIKTHREEAFFKSLCARQVRRRQMSETICAISFNTISLVQNVIAGVGLTALTLSTGRAVLQGELSLGDFVLFNGYLLQLLLPVGILGSLFRDLKKAAADLRNVERILSIPHQAGGTQTIDTNHQWTLKLEDVSFKHNRHYILKSVSMEIRSGSSVLLRGKSGVGKTTFIKLLQGILKPTHGRILLNGVDIAEIAPSQLKGLFGVIPQDVKILNSSLTFNVKITNPEASSYQVQSALTNAELVNLSDEDICSVTAKGYSGGERQRIGFARIFLKKPKICILDEATSNMDKRTEQTILSRFNNIFETSTKIIISHSDKFYSFADEVYELRNGNFLSLYERRSSSHNQTA